MAQINIRRDDDGNVTFDSISVDTTETVFFTNLDDQSKHWPTLAANRVGPFKSPNSSECPVNLPAGSTLPFRFTYGCQIEGHEGEQGVIMVFSPLAVGADVKAGKLPAATTGKPLAKPQQVVKGGKPPYTINRQVFQVTDGNGIVTPGAGGLQLNNNAATPNDATGITVSGTPTLSGTYTFALDVNDSMGKNLQQQYTMVATA
jgi:hypothetical protein